ncbi:MAG TPA: serine/threonine-protein kinase, partial [Pyrinomonadaceae bacterium]|nr:serine/threonine-protein kinase [Pyrinomonadaceae bacterium]
MERTLWDRIQEIYYSALTIGESERPAFIVTECDSDPFVIKEVTSLLNAEKSTGDFLHQPIFELGLRLIDGAAEQSLDQLIGTIIDKRYRIVKKLGRGGIGAVYLAHDLRLHNKPVAVKVLLPESLQAPYLIRRFKQEAEALSRINHPGVVDVITAGELADGKLYIVMQYVEGVTLRSQMAAEGMDFERVASFIRQVGAALHRIHEKGIFHRDLKPENIMLQTFTDGSEFVKLVDFGIAKVQDSLVAPSTINEAPIGTVIYMSPEQLRGEKAGAASDIFSMA